MQLVGLASTSHPLSVVFQSISCLAALELRVACTDRWPSSHKPPCARCIDSSASAIVGLSFTARASSLLKKRRRLNFGRIATCKRWIATSLIRNIGCFYITNLTPKRRTSQEPGCSVLSPHTSCLGALIESHWALRTSCGASTRQYSSSETATAYERATHLAQTTL